MIHQIFAIGPLQGSNPEQGRIGYFIYPGDPERPVLFGNSLADVWNELIEPLGDARVTVEPMLAEEAKAIGVEAKELAEDTRAILCAIAFDIALPGTFDRIDDDQHILAFARDFSAFAKAAVGEQLVELTVRLEVSDGSTELRDSVLVGGPGLVILDQRLADGPTGQVTELDGIAALVGEAEPAVLGALGRAVGLSVVPQPFRLLSGSKEPLDVDELLLLNAALEASSRLLSEEVGEVMIDVERAGQSSRSRLFMSLAR